MATADDVLSDALKLSEKERARIAHELLQSLDAGEDVDAAEEWDKEIEKRAQEVLDGTAKTVPWSEMEARLSARIAKK